MRKTATKAYADELATRLAGRNAQFASLSDEQILALQKSMREKTLTIGAMLRKANKK